jgi:hypothetical protein
MKKIYSIFFITILILGCKSQAQKDDVTNTDSILKIELNLSAFGVESDDFPFIDVAIDFVKRTSECKKWYYNPSKKETSYSLNKSEMDRLLKILQNIDLEKFKKDYKVNKTDQPNSKMTIYTEEKTFTINDYGLESDSTLEEIYNIVYKL